MRNPLNLCPKNSQPTDVIFTKNEFAEGFCDIICGNGNFVSSDFLNEPVDKSYTICYSFTRHLLCQLGIMGL